MTGKCKFCGEVKDLREGGCWECANAESIIDDGTDMYDKGIHGASSGQKLKLLIEKGWTSKHATPLMKAVLILQDSLKEDKTEGSYYYSWQANIAVSFRDEYNRWKELHDNDDPQPSDVNEISNQAAKNFLNLFISQQHPLN